MGARREYMAVSVLHQRTKPPPVGGPFSLAPRRAGGMVATFVLIHSPLVGPSTWQPVAAELRGRGYNALVPSLAEQVPADEPFWSAHADAVARAIVAASTGASAGSEDTHADAARDHNAPVKAAVAANAGPLILVAHSGAGPLLPAIRARLGTGVVVGYLFVDAGVPERTASRQAMLRESDHDPGMADQLEAHLAAGGRFPEWQDADLRMILPDDTTRRALLAKLRPRAEPFWREPLPVPANWPDAPAAYLRFSAPYAATAERVRARGWPSRTIEAGHFHMLVDPTAVTAALEFLVDEMGLGAAARGPSGPGATLRRSVRARRIGGSGAALEAPMTGVSSDERAPPHTRVGDAAHPFSRRAVTPWKAEPSA